MMNLEQFYGIEWPINFSQAEEDLFNRKWNHPTGFNKLDSILASEKEIDNLCTVLEKMEDSSFDLLKTPSLREFEFTSRETGPVMNPVMTIVRYKETALPKMPFVITPEDDTSKMHIVLSPYVDAYISFQKKDVVDAVDTLFTATFYDDNGNHAGTGTCDKIMWLNAETGIADFIDNHLHDQEIAEVFRNIRLIYLSIQRAMNHHPTVFYSPTGRTNVQRDGSSYQRKEKAPCRVVRKIRLNRDELKKYAGPVKHMQCPCWGVIGHTRHYKNGKEVWIKPYRKGKHRNNPMVYVPKEYLMEE